MRVHYNIAATAPKIPAPKMPASATCPELAPPVNGTVEPLGGKGLPVPVPVAMGMVALPAKVAVVTGVEEAGVVTGAAEVGASEGVEDGVAEAAEDAATVWPGLKPGGRVTPN